MCGIQWSHGYIIVQIYLYLNSFLSSDCASRLYKYWTAPCPPVSQCL